MNHQPRKCFGQHFLADDTILLNMQFAIRPAAQDHLVEIGPGLGALTQHLIDYVSRYDAIEIDRDLATTLNSLFKKHPGFKLHVMDVLCVNWRELVQENKLRVVGNLPYNISTPLLFHLFAALDVVSDMYFLLQKEVGERLAAPVGSTHFGRLSVMAQYYCDVELLFDVPPQAFMPPPKVNSVFLKLIPKQNQYPLTNKLLFERVVATAFNQRRKTLRNSLHSLMDVSLLDSLHIDSKKRAQEISILEYVHIANKLAEPREDCHE